MKLTIDFNKVFKEPGVSLAEIVYLCSLKGKNPDLVVQVIVNFRSEINFDYLIENKYIEVTNNDYSKAKLLISLDNFVTINAKNQKDNLDLFEAYFNLFPSGMVNGRLLRSDKKATYTKLIAFIKEFPDYEPVVIQATEKALEVAKMKGYQYMQNTSYFISKNKESQLAAFCQAVLDNSSPAVVNSIMTKFL
jgi:hypothetical protein